MIDLNPDATTASPSRISMWVLLIICVSAFVGGLFTMHIWNVVRESMNTQTRTETDVYEEDTNMDDEVIPSGEISSVSTESELVIDWIDPSKQQQVTVDARVSEVLCPDLSEPDSEKSWSQCGNPPQISQLRLGVVVGGVYDGRFLEMVSARIEGMGFANSTLYLLIDSTEENLPVLLDQVAQNSNESFPSTYRYTASEIVAWSGMSLNEAFPGYTLETTALIPDLVANETLTDIHGNRFILSGEWVRYDAEVAVSVIASQESIQLEDGRSLFLYEAGEGASTQVGKNQYFLVGKDGRLAWYDLEVAFLDYTERAEGFDISQGIPNITWNDGSENTQTYMKGALGGCGFTTATHVVSKEIINTLELGQSGTGLYDANETVKIYEPANYEMSYFEDAFNAVTFSSADEDPKTYEDFVHPYLYFQDAFDRWIELASIDIVPAVECGKPVIYLYPEVQTDLSVWVSPRGGFSYTEPEYGNGWNVTAFPDGRIINRSDAKQYPYLFWEGRGGFYPSVQTYWIVEQSDVEVFLENILARMNLNQSEIEDFVEFWLPRMQTAVYYKIGFNGTAVMNELAPLNFSVKPDHIFRVLMDYEGLETWEASKPPKNLPYANRDGFEVIEWGGVLR
ncbi:hypothetical protein HQ487_00625 [Candidatus Uhrbacteria bacterium]|nr:hypothetical protein [Candidatus Uhrbacteria bacterium]